MAAGTITVSPRVHVDELERLVRARVERDGGVEVAARTADRGQLAKFRRLSRRLRADDRLACFPFSDTPDGGSYLMVLSAGVDLEATGWTWRGDAKLA
jgi:hypothetical protein